MGYSYLLSLQGKLAMSLVAIILWLNTANGQSQLVRNLKEGKNQILVVYGTSLTASKGGKAWLQATANALNEKYGNRLTVFNAARGGMWSTWGVQNIEDSVLMKKPDAVMIEFGINDAFTDKKTSLDLSRLNLNYMIDRIRLYNPNCEIILQIMNMPIGKPADNRPRLKDYYDIYRQVAEEKNLLLIDHYPNWEKILKKGKEYFLKYIPDGIHPNPEATVKVVTPYIVTRLEQGK